MTLKTEIHGIVKLKEGVLMNEDQEGLKRYKSNKLRNKKLQGMQQEFETLKNDVSEIKRMLSLLVSKL